MELENTQRLLKLIWRFGEEQNIYMVLRDLPVYYLLFMKEKNTTVRPWRNMAGTTLYQETLDKPRPKDVLQNSSSSFEESAFFENVVIEKKAEEIVPIKGDETAGAWPAALVEHETLVLVVVEFEPKAGCRDDLKKKKKKVG